MIGYITDKNNTVGIETVSQSATISSYTPKNKKCFCYPYCMLVLTNFSGESQTLKWEDFSYSNSPRQTVEININRCVSQNPVYSAMPMNHKGLTYDFNALVQFNNFPQLPWNYDAYANWFALNSNSILFGFLSKGITAATNAASENVSGAVSSGVSMLSDYLSLMDKKKQPEQTRGTVQGNLLLYLNHGGIYAQVIESKAEYIVMVDEFFSHYGYAVNETKVPTFHKRPNFDYIKTRDINIVGNIPNEDIEELENIFNDGVTIWHNANTYGDYNVNNAPT